MNTEEIKKQFLLEGFANVYDWIDGPGKEYEEHSHKGKVSFYVVKGSILMNVNGIHTTVYAGNRFDVPEGLPHTAKVGNEGCMFVVAEEIKGDS